MIDLNLACFVLAALILLATFGWHLYSNSLAIQCWFLNLAFTWRRWRGFKATDFWSWLAWRMPRRLVYWCTVRCATHATTGPWSHVQAPGVTIADMLKRWDSR